ncbi:hypothetical protein FA95DRAFT_1309107 [Auriscalpium vulgare]|uniref:Uncharacterized protein n=1 Tax=Auriscalpium vulgare TaxID=40419 RepID=A0ACB8RRZ8_9AGAM|nr:hypothetical protein FA95DRAFT_1309107 [Auriscalpium vulgare]
MLARANGWIACADVIAQWVADKDRDLRERETLITGVIPPDEPEMCGCERDDCVHAQSECPVTTVRRRIGVKRSVDNALQLLKPTASSSPASSSPAPDSPILADAPTPPPETAPRRPTLPYTPPGSNGSSSSRKVKRPSSAGTGAGTGTPRKLGSKYSLLHLFKRQSSEELDGSEPGRPGILRAHARTSSTSNGGGVRFGGDGEASPRVRVGSLSPDGDEEDEEDDEFEDDDDDDDEEEEYGQPIPTRFAPRRPRGQSGSSQTSLPSPLSKGSTLAPGVEFPFSIERPPVDDSHSPARGAPDGRARGDSQSTTFSVRTPAPAPGQLPQPRIASPDSPPTPSFSIDSGAGPVEPAGEKPQGSGEWTPCALNVRAVSSHAQAEALVAQTQRAVLELAAEAEADAKMPLSARLAAYGESLRLERQFKMREAGVEAEGMECTAGGGGEVRMERRASEGVAGGLGLVDDEDAAQRPYGVKARSASATMDRELAGIPTIGGGGRRRGLDRNLSLEHRGTPRKSRTRRPHTAGGTPKAEGAFLSPIRPTESRAGHHRSRSAAPPRIDADLANANVSTTPAHGQSASPASSALPTPLSSCTSAATATATVLGRPLLATPPHTATALPPRARTPDAELEGARDARGVPLARVLTAPPQDTLNDLGAGTRRDHPPHVLRANKLARMGFAPDKAEKEKEKVPASARQRLGGLKSFVQSLKGKP